MTQVHRCFLRNTGTSHTLTSKRKTPLWLLKSLNFKRSIIRGKKKLTTKNFEAKKKKREGAQRFQILEVSEKAEFGQQGE